MLNASPRQLIWMICGEVLAAVVMVMVAYSDPRFQGAPGLSAGLAMGYIMTTGVCVVLITLFLRRGQKASPNPKVLVDGQMLPLIALASFALITAESLSLQLQGAKSIELKVLTTISAESLVWKLAFQGPLLMLGGVAGLWWNRMLERTS